MSDRTHDTRSPEELYDDLFVHARELTEATERLSDIYRERLAALPPVKSTVTDTLAELLAVDEAMSEHVQGKRAKWPEGMAAHRYSECRTSSDNASVDGALCEVCAEWATLCNRRQKAIDLLIVHARVLRESGQGNHVDAEVAA